MMCLVLLVFYFEVWLELEVEFSWFYIDYCDWVIQLIVNVSQVLSNIIYVLFVDVLFIFQVQVDVLVNVVRFYNFIGVFYDLSKVVVIIYM